MGVFLQRVKKGIPIKPEKACLSKTFDHVEGRWPEMNTEQGCSVCSDSNEYPRTTHLKEHSVCRGCLTEYLHVKIRKEGLVSVPCPALGCNVTLQYDDIRLFARISD